MQTATDHVKRTYPQNWAAYNAAQTTEKQHFLKLLHDLCSGIEEPQGAPTGRPRLPLKEAIFACCFKIYSTVSARRFMTDLRAACEEDYISRTPHFNSIFNYLENPRLTQLLRQLIIETSLPLKAVETDFAVDSSGFTTSRYVRWVDYRYNHASLRKGHSWVKVHLMCGVRTNIVTSVEILGKHTHDTVPFPDLVDATAENFQVKEISADKAYGSGYNYKTAERHGATPFIAFKSNSRAGDGGLWTKMYHYFQFNREEFLSRYHKRSNVETTFSMIKRKFGDSVRSKTETAQVNECLCKIICHNICCLIQESHELGIDISLAGNLKST